MILVVAGKFQPKKVLELVAKYFGPIPQPERQLNSTYTEEPPQDGEHVVRFVRHRKRGRRGSDLSRAGRRRGRLPRRRSPAQFLSDEPSGRLYKSLVETKKAANVYGEAWSMHDPGVMILMARVAQGQEPKAVLDAMLATIADVAKKGVTKEEVERIKRQILKQREMDCGKQRTHCAGTQRVGRSGRLASLLRPPRPHRKSDCGGGLQGGGPLFEAGQFHARTLPPDQVAGPHDDPDDCRFEEIDRQLQGA